MQYDDQMLHKGKRREHEPHQEATISEYESEREYTAKDKGKAREDDTNSQNEVPEELNAEPLDYSYDFDPIPQVRQPQSEMPISYQQMQEQFESLVPKVDLDRVCICGKTTNHYCGACKTKYYCSRPCQLRDRHQHRSICKPYALVSSMIENKTSDVAKINNLRGVFKKEHWQKYFELIYDALYRRARADYAHEDTSRGMYYTTWLQIIDDEEFGKMPSDLVVGLIYITQEPDRLFMYIQKAEDDKRNTPILLDRAAVVFRTTVDKGKSTAYTIKVDIPKRADFYIDWNLRAYNGSRDDDDEDDDS